MWKNGNKNGEGILFKKDGTPRNGFWEDGKRLKWI
jgi:hypothetical protein